MESGKLGFIEENGYEGRGALPLHPTTFLKKG